MPRPINQRDEFAQMYVAAIFADEGWILHFPVPDRGFDFIATKKTSEGVVIRPVQVKGKYPESVTRTARTYGYGGELTMTHPTMVLAIPFFHSNERSESPALIAYIPFSQIRETSRWPHCCFPAQHILGRVKEKEEYEEYFGVKGIRKFENPNYV